MSIQYGMAKVAVMAVVLFTSSAWAADPLSPALQAKVANYKNKIVAWAADPVIVAAVKAANAKEHFVGMTNAKWLDMDEKSPEIQAALASKASMLIKQWEVQDKNTTKIILRDVGANFVAGNIKPLIYNNKAIPVNIEAMKGSVWAAPVAMPDTTTQVNSIHVSAPVMDGGKVIGVLQMGLTAN